MARVVLSPFEHGQKLERMQPLRKLSCGATPKEVTVLNRYRVKYRMQTDIDLGTALTYDGLAAVLRDFVRTGFERKGELAPACRGFTSRGGWNNFAMQL